MSSYLLDFAGYRRCGRTSRPNAYVYKRTRPCATDLTPLVNVQYGGDISRKMKLLNKQKEGKKKMKMIGNVELSHETFQELLKR